MLPFVMAASVYDISQYIPDTLTESYEFLRSGVVYWLVKLGVVDKDTKVATSRSTTSVSSDGTCILSFRRFRCQRSSLFRGYASSFTSLLSLVHQTTRLLANLSTPLEARSTMSSPRSHPLKNRSKTFRYSMAHKVNGRSSRTFA